MKLSQNFIQNILTSIIVSFAVVGFVWAFTGPGANQPPNGDVTLTSVPSGMVMYTVSATCPSGWTEFTAARGRYIVGVPSEGTVSSTVGTALSNSEDRAVGQHSHTASDSGHTHSMAGGWQSVAQGVDNSVLYYYQGSHPNTYTGYASITVNASGTTAGTNAPYIQLLACRKT